MEGNMERFLLVTLFILGGYQKLAFATSPSDTKPASTSKDDDDKDSSDKKENEDQKTFTDKVKSIRSVSGEYDVFFVEHFGPYSVPFSLPNAKNKEMTPDEILASAHKQGIPVTVTIDTKTDSLISIDSDLARAPASAQEPKIDIPPDMEYLRDIIKTANKPKN
jgi:hypothetical protein